ncbi:MAG: Gfo/Idh/MocA family oxidoreductase [Nitrospira sp.]|jgi:glucose-fructose oxidoreductase|nr:Gfo/Idh/MocA family oxidoreductase [Nitrospira sp.]MDI3463823.1 Glucose-fructose oxidoreductase [Nitrospira sp.]
MGGTVSTKKSIVPRTKSRPQVTPVRYAVVGLGHIAQVAVMPAFAHATRNSKLTALVSDDPQKLKQLSRRYEVPYCYSYRQYDQCLREGHIDAVYIALPNSLHCDYAVRAADAGIHVLCEKPMAVTEQECRRMIQAADRADTKLMVAYRLHFEEANMDTVELARSGKLGHLRLFNSVFTMQVREGNIRVEAELGGGSLYDIGVYCINAARYVFQANPTKVSACTVRGTDRRFREVDEMATAWLEFPGNRLATFVCSFGAADVSAYEVVGTKGHVRMDPAYEYVGDLRQNRMLNGKSRSHRYEGRDQFAPELLYFSDCVLNDHGPEPSGLEGLIDVTIIEALYRSAKTSRPVSLSLPDKKQWSSHDQVIKRPPVQKPTLVHVKSPSL